MASILPHILELLLDVVHTSTTEYTTVEACAHVTKANLSIGYEDLSNRLLGRWNASDVKRDCTFAALESFQTGHSTRQ